MTEGPNGPVIDLLAELRHELLVLNDQMRELRGVAGREIPAPRVEVLPAPVVVQPGESPAAPSVDLRPLLAALQGIGSQDQVVKALEGLQKEIKDYQGIIRAIAGSAYGGGIGGSVVTAGGVFPTSQAEDASPFRVQLPDGYQVEVANDVGNPLTVKLDAGSSHYTTSAASLKVGQGKFFLAGAAIDLGGLASTDRASFQLKNPTGSGKVLHVVALTIYSSITQQVKYTEDATMPADATSVTPLNLNRSSTAASSAEVKYSVTAPTGGTDWSNQSRVYNSAPLILQLPPVVLPPGKSLTIRGTSGDAQTFTANAYYIEEPL